MSKRKNTNTNGDRLDPSKAQPEPASVHIGVGAVEPPARFNSDPRIWCAILILIYLFLAGVNSTVVPVLNKSEGSLINAPDEAAHLAYIDIVREQHRLPTRGDGTYEWHQPPLYYVLAAPVSAIGPHAVRFLNIVFGAAIIACIFAFARRLIPDQPMAAVGAAAFVALLPMHQAIMSAAGNDVLLELLISLLLLVLLKPKAASDHDLATKSWRRAACIGTIWGLAILTKTSALLIFPVIVAAQWLELGFSFKKPVRFIRSVAIIGSLAFVFALPWMVRNKGIYAELLPMRAFQEEFAGTSKRSDWIGKPRQVDIWTGNLQTGEPMDAFGYLNLTTNWTARTFEGAYTPRKLASQGIPLFLPPVFYGLFLLSMAVAAVGLIRSHLHRNEWFTVLVNRTILILFGAIVIFVGALIAFQIKYFQAQGRYLFPSMLPIAVLVGLGWNSAFSGPLARRVVAGCIAAMVLLSLLFLLGAILPAYGN